MSQVRRALLSVSDKTGIVELARGLQALGIELISTGGTARTLGQAGLRVREVTELTGFPEMLDGRVKTLHPAIHGGLLARRGHPEHMQELARQRIEPIDLVAVNLYPFEQAVARPGASCDEIIENIDIGGPAMIRAAAKNHAAVAVLVDPGQYGPVLEELGRTGGELSPETRHRLAREAFRRTAQYDAAIAAWLRTPAPPRVPAVEAPPLCPPVLRLEAERVMPLRYGENPHQQAALYRPVGAAYGVGAARQLLGPELSYNNLLDLSAALALLLEFEEPAAVVIKHTNPCGAAVGPDALAALERAKASDPVSIYGGIVGVNRPVDLALLPAFAGVLLEILFAPGFADEALEEFGRTKRKLRVIEVPCDRRGWPARATELRSVLGGVLLQEADLADLDPAACKAVTRREPTAAEWQGLRFAWRVAKHVKSNAIVLATIHQVLGVGAGQMSRVDAARLAVMRAREHGHETAGSVAASDAFFPFRDGLDVVADAGVTAVIHPGGSVRDGEVVAAADARGIAMVHTGIRHFKH
ncbi:MAG: bifunctional phosphoribosylaminoimidazolecarboxamide formyltransferase/IMP cyclohydrolase [Candidatus Rokubacteria bacterium]|nr:bifunctional phosphoribosylaminoimidazolecarboxamide formyltransferase/IMP cyclohydrolase [Candidatus Rokubacteria bacterium]